MLSHFADHFDALLFAVLFQSVDTVLPGDYRGQMDAPLLIQQITSNMFFGYIFICFESYRWIESET